MAEVVDAIVKLCNLPHKVVDKALDFAERAIGKPLRIAGNLLADELYAWQCRNRIKALAAVAEELKRRRISPRGLPEGFVAKYLREVGEVDDETLRAAWVRLGASAVADDAVQHPALMNLLRDLCADEAKFLESFNKTTTIAAVRVGIWPGRMLTAVPEAVGCKYPERESFYIMNLARLGIIDITSGAAPDPAQLDAVLKKLESIAPSGSRDLLGIVLTAVGQLLWQACIKPDDG